MNYEINLNKSAHINGSRSAVLSRLVELGASHDGAPQAAEVLADARNPESPLHGEFVWDGDQAIEQLGLERAQYLCRQLVMVTINPVTKKSYTGPAVINVSAPHTKAQNMSVGSALSDPKYRAMMITQLTNRLIKLRAELETFEEFSGVVIAISALD